MAAISWRPWRRTWPWGSIPTGLAQRWKDGSPSIGQWRRPSQSRIDGAVIEVDAFGNLITNIMADMLAGRPTDRRACVVCNIFETWGIYHAYAEQTSGTLVAVIGSSGRLELAIVRDNAAERLGVGVGTPVTVAWE